MAKFTFRPSPPKPAESAPPVNLPDRLPSNAELLHELRKHGAKSSGPRELPAVSRRTRDYLLTAGVGSASILFLSFKLLTDSDVLVILRLALTGVALLCGLLWFIFYGVMGRY
ncbi:MAG: hypothetical protein EXS32_04100 [Opitutus sp.]|nr:hypothetical protein [Opitutus sp.]